MNTQTPEPTRSRISPALIIFLVLPLLALLAAALFILTTALAPSRVEPTPEPVAFPGDADVINAPMIDFTLPTLSGTEISLSDFQGRIVFLNFWATWCGPCERELPALQAFARQQMNLPDGAVVLAVNQQESAEDVQRFLDARSISALIIPMDVNGDVGDMYGVFNLPVTFVIDRNGVVRYPKYGEVTAADLEAYMAELNTNEAT
ncbi:MAG: TlpA family protein disulfide reductase [Anaerolineae bacterium]|nr:TlpA family protein disulfide reductase [Anaerolineae bacterium]NUQ05613.1 TlpA family protein disulfide reductase [Anaerolineae bacterium]